MRKLRCIAFAWRPTGCTWGEKSNSSLGSQRMLRIFKEHNLREAKINWKPSKREDWTTSKEFWNRIKAERDWEKINRTRIRNSAISIILRRRRRKIKCEAFNKFQQNFKFRNVRRWRRTHWHNKQKRVKNNKIKV